MYFSGEGANDIPDNYRGAPLGTDSHNANNWENVKARGLEPYFDATPFFQLNEVQHKVYINLDSVARCLLAPVWILRNPVG